MPDLSTPAPSKAESSLEDAIHSTDPETLLAAAGDPALNENLALVLLKRNDLLPEVLERVSKNAGALKSRKVKLALVSHLKTPRHVSLPMARHLFTFELVKVALSPAVPADLKMSADEVLISRLEAIPSGERLSLARRASGRVAGALLLDPEPRVMRTALENSRLTEAPIIRTLMRFDSTAPFVDAVCHYPKWAQRREIRVALLRNEKTPLAHALEFARSLPAPMVREILHGSRLPANVKKCLMKDLEQRVAGSGLNRRRP